MQSLWSWCVRARFSIVVVVIVAVTYLLMVVQANAQAISCPDNKSGMEAQYRVAEKLETGRGVTRNVPAAMACYEQAAARGHAPSMSKLGMLYYNGDVLGDSVPADPKMAWTWFTLASVHGERSATAEAQRIEADLNQDALESLREKVGEYLLVGVIIPRSTQK